MVSELAGLYRVQLLFDPLVHPVGGTKKSSRGGFSIEVKDLRFRPFKLNEG